MKVSTRLSEGQRTLIISVEGEFDADQHVAFREAYQSRPRDMEYVVDLSSVDRLDSSALGLLLMLREHAGGDRARVVLRGAPPAVRKVLELSRFERLFDLR